MLEKLLLMAVFLAECQGKVEKHALETSSEAQNYNQNLEATGSNVNPNSAQVQPKAHLECSPQHKQQQNLRILVTGGSGFLGSHLVDSLMRQGHKVVVLDNLSTSRADNLAQWATNKSLTTVWADVSQPEWLETIGRVDQIYHLASPASPKHYQPHPIETIRANTLGTINVLELADKHKARMVLASTSEIYGSPLVHPQTESYWGNVNPVGPRSCYDESKRLAETLAVSYRDQRNVSIGIARIFNTYGPRMRIDDGRVVSNFITQALTSSNLTIYGDGFQTRSFMYVDDLIRGLEKLMTSSINTPVNLGNPLEQSILSLATRIRELLGDACSSGLVFKPSPVDDPPRRQPEISFAKQALDWQPNVSLDDGLLKTIDYFRQKSDVPDLPR